MSAIEERLAFQLRAVGIPFVREVAGLIPGRRFRVDFLIDQWLVVECQGGLRMAKGGHNTHSGITRDCEKLAELLIHGYPTLACTADQVRTGTALRWIERMIETYKRKEMNHERRAIQRPV